MSQRSQVIFGYMVTPFEPYMGYSGIKLASSCLIASLLSHKVSILYVPSIPCETKTNKLCTELSCIIVISLQFTKKEKYVEIYGFTVVLNYIQPQSHVTRGVLTDI